jgi:hypothetical protein
MNTNRIKQILAKNKIQPTIHNFAEQQRKFSKYEWAFLVIADIWGKDTIIKTNCDIQKDKQGVDLEIVTPDNQSITIDVKQRNSGSSKYWGLGMPELPIEFWSCIERKQPGWIIDDTKINDWVLFVFDPSDSNHYFLFHTNELRKVAKYRIHTWRRNYKTYIQHTKGNWEDYHSEVAFIPVKELIHCYKTDFPNALMQEGMVIQ